MTDLNNSGAEFLTKLLEKSDLILIKKLSNNDRDWSRLSNKHQAGVYIPHEFRDGGFFRSLDSMERNIEGNLIRETFFTTIWPQYDNIQKKTRLVHYTSKGQETHMTRLPKEAFMDLLPASYLVMGRYSLNNEFTYVCLTIDSGSEEANFLLSLFGFDANFLIGVFNPNHIKSEERNKILDFAEQVIHSWLNGKISLFAKQSASMPLTIDLAHMARKEYFLHNGINNLNPFELNSPGDVLREISRNIEWKLFKEYQRRERSVELVRTLIGDEPRRLDARDIIKLLIDKFSDIDAILLSASQQRKARAGYSYEHHIEALLQDGNIPFEKQTIIESKKRPDFILPSLRYVDNTKAGARNGLILSAKTTLRERWKQVEREKKNRRLFLTTVDENIAGNSIEDMASIGVQLVIPESLLKSRETEYSNHENVISFKEFCNVHIRPHLENWNS